MADGTRVWCEIGVFYSFDFLYYLTPSWKWKFVCVDTREKSLVVGKLGQLPSIFSAPPLTLTYSKLNFTRSGKIWVHPDRLSTIVRFLLLAVANTRVKGDFVSLGYKLNQTKDRGIGFAWCGRLHRGAVITVRLTPRLTKTEASSRRGRKDRLTRIRGSLKQTKKTCQIAAASGHVGRTATWTILYTLGFPFHAFLSVFLSFHI